MAKKQVELRSEYLNFLRFSVTESAPSTFTQIEIDTNLSAERGVMMEIHSIDFQFETIRLFDECPTNGQELLQVIVARESMSGIIPISNADVIARTAPEMIRNGNDGAMFFATNRMARIDFPLPIPYVKPSIFVGILGTDSGTPHTVMGRIGYTLRDIDREDFLELLVALQ